MIFADAIGASPIGCALRVQGWRQVFRWADGRMELYTSTGRRYGKLGAWWHRRLASLAHKDWTPVGMTYDEVLARLDRAERRWEIGKAR